MALKSINCTGQITNTGGLEITEKGFCYSKTNTNPDLNDSVWVVPGTVPSTSNGYYFYDTITGLDEATQYWVNSYAINSLGIDYSNITQTVITTGIAVHPTVTVNITNNNLPQVLYEMGTSNFLVITGMTVPNSETLFINGYLNQTSNPQPSNPIKTWTGFQSTYTTASPPISVNFLPRALEPQSWGLTGETFYNCGNPPYIINDKTAIESVFPFLWVMKNNYQNATYFSNSTFYTEASASQNDPYVYNGKVIIKKPAPFTPIEFLVTPNDALHKYLILAWPDFYGNAQYSLNPAGPFISPPYPYGTSTVTTNSTLATPYSYPFKIIQYVFATYSDKPIPFYLQFVS